MDISQVASLFVVGALLSAVGVGVNRLVFPNGGQKALAKGWRRAFYLTMPFHPIVAGASLGAFSGLPAPAFLGQGAAAAVSWYALAGALAPALYGAVRGWVKVALLEDRHD